MQSAFETFAGVLQPAEQPAENPHWDRDGWVIWYKRLEEGTFQFPFAETGRKELAAWELGVLLEGIDLRQGKRRKRYEPPAAAAAESIKQL